MKGCFTALLTPFKNGKVDFDSFEKLINHQVAGDIDGVIPCGTTGESPTLSHAEHREVIQFTIDRVRKLNAELNKSVQVVAGTGSNSTEESLGLSRDAEKYGADGLLIVAPYYNKPTQNGLIAHFEAVANAVSSDIILYNVPGRSGVLIEPETVAELSRRCQNIKTVKDATGDIDMVGKVLSRNHKLDILSGNDSMNLPIYAVGGVGCISVLSNLFPAEVKEVLSLYESGKVKEARELHYKRWDLGETLFTESNPIPLKTAAKILGIIESDEIRLPLTPASKAVVDKLESLLN